MVGVSPAAQGLGLGSLLTLTGLHHLRERGLGEVILYVEADNAAAVKVYSRLGFTHAEEDTDVMYRRPPRLSAARSPTPTARGEPSPPPELRRDLRDRRRCRTAHADHVREPVHERRVPLEVHLDPGVGEQPGVAPPPRRAAGRSPAVTTEAGARFSGIFSVKCTDTRGSRRSWSGGR